MINIHLHRIGIRRVVPVMVDRKRPQFRHGRKLGVVSEVVVIEYERVKFSETLKEIDIPKEDDNKIGHH